MSVQVKVKLNEIPHQTLTKLGTKKAVILTSEKDEGKVFVSTTLNPEDLREVSGLEVFADIRKKEGVYGITMTILKLDSDVMKEATSFLPNRYRLIAELDTLLRHNEDVYVAYVITHYNPGQKPCGPLTINIGGDCYRTGEDIKDLESILKRTKDLAKAMLKKAVMVFPDIPALHGGKKGEWIILDSKGQKIDGISEDAVIALGSAIIPAGVGFLNHYKELQAKEMGIFESFPAHNYIRPDTGSPDVLSGVYWRGERPDKYINMCDAWYKRGINTANFTCLPYSLGGTLDPSARPTGYGVASTAIVLAKNYFVKKKVKDLRYLIEAAGGVGRNTVEALIEIHGIPPENITVFDRADAACKFVAEKYKGTKTIALDHKDFYTTRLVQDGIKYDVWINNGEGDNTTPQYVENLLNASIRVFCGGANNFLQVATEQESLQKIFTKGGWAWPDPATSAGGWTLAVVDVMTRCQGEKSNTKEKQKQILDTITERNTRLIEDVLSSLNKPTGKQLWKQVDKVIRERANRTLSMKLSPKEIFELADVTKWKLTSPSKKTKKRK